MSAPIYVCEVGQRRLYKVGRVGFDSGTADAGGTYTATLRTEKISPTGEFGLSHFRRIGFRIFRTGSFTITVKVYVDGVQTKIFDSSSAKIDQVITITKAAPTISPEETLVDADIDASGTYIEVELTVASNQVTGVFLPEELDIHYRPIRPVRQTAAAESQ